MSEVSHPTFRSTLLSRSLMAQPEAQQSDAATDKMAAAAAAAAVAATPNGITHGKPAAAPAPAAAAAADVIEHTLALEAYRRREQEALRFIQTVTSNAQAVQDEVLAAILTRNANTEYLQRHGLAGRTDKDAFRRLLPSITYEDLQPEIQRIANGDTSPILSSHPISEFLTSSGTSAGERKLMPTISEEFERRTLLYSLLMPVMNQYLPDLHKGKGMFFLFIRPEAKTPGGLLARPVLTSYYKSPYFTNRPYDPYNVLTSPNEVVLCPDAHQTMYCHLMCGLLQRHQVLRMGAVFASGFIRAIRFLEEHWRELVADMRAGVLSERLVTDAAARQAVQALMDDMDVHAGAGSRLRDVADAVERQCGGKDWRGIITRLWPNAKYIEVVITGTMAQYIPTLDYYSGGLPLASTMYASSECYFGINLKPLCSPSEVTYTLLPNMCYYEFLPVTRGGAGAGDVDAAASFKLQLQQQQQQSESGSADAADAAADGIEQQLVELQDVQVGREYELLLTTYAGLYRYRVGDVLRCTGFHNAAPQFHFVCRKNVVLSIDADKTDEQDLHAAVDAAARAHLHPAGARLIEYTSYADTTSSIPGHYVLYWELRYDAAVDAVQAPAGAAATASGAAATASGAAATASGAAATASGAAATASGAAPTAPAAPTAACGAAPAASASAELLHACAHTVEESLDVIYRAGRCEGSIGPLEIKVVKPGTFDALMDYALSRGASINQYKTPRCVKFNPIVELLNARVAASYSALTLPHWLSHRP